MPISRKSSAAALTVDANQSKEQCSRSEEEAGPYISILLLTPNPTVTCSPIVRGTPSQKCETLRYLSEATLHFVLWLHHPAVYAGATFRTVTKAVLVSSRHAAKPPHRTVPHGNATSCPFKQAAFWLHNRVPVDSGWMGSFALQDTNLLHHCQNQTQPLTNIVPMHMDFWTQRTLLSSRNSVTSRNKSVLLFVKYIPLAGSRSCDDAEKRSALLTVWP